MKKSDALARRLHQVRLAKYGEDGGPLLAEDLGLPAQTWAHYEAGVTIPGLVLLGFIEITGVAPIGSLRAKADEISPAPKNRTRGVSGSEVSPSDCDVPGARPLFRSTSLDPRGATTSIKSQRPGCLGEFRAFQSNPEVEHPMRRIRGESGQLLRAAGACGILEGQASAP